MNINPNADFGTRDCPGCGVEVAANQNRCPICGYQFPALPNREVYKLLGAVIMLIVFISGAFCLRYLLR